VLDGQVGVAMSYAELALLDREDQGRDRPSVGDPEGRTAADTSEQASVTTGECDHDLGLSRWALSDK
jgi:hypothetical protein